MLERYSREAAAETWSPAIKFRRWLKVELAVLETRIARGEINATIPKNLYTRIFIDPGEIDRLEAEVTKHDVVAFLLHISPQLPEDLRPWFHQKLTSYDPQDTALSLTLVHSIEILMQGVRANLAALKERAIQYKYTPMIGRTHGIHAEPITFGCKLAKWHAEMERHFFRLKQLRKTVAVGRLSGAVGMYTLDPEIEEAVCENLGLQPILATQIIPRDIITEYAGMLAIIAGGIENFCTTLRNLARTEIREVMEYFDTSQRGSSAMPHKKNPRTWEQISSLCRDIKSRFFTALQNQISWDERDLANSAAERLYLPEISIYMDYILDKFAASIRKMWVFPEQMKQNLELTKGLIFSQDVLALLASKSNLPREDAYSIVKETADYCWNNNYAFDFFEELANMPTVMQYITRDELRACFNLEEKLKHTDAIFRKAFE